MTKLREKPALGVGVNRLVRVAHRDQVVPGAEDACVRPFPATPGVVIPVVRVALVEIAQEVLRIGQPRAPLRRH